MSNNDAAVLNQYQNLRQELQSLSEKLGELEMDADEHRLVVAALTPLIPSRKCWRRVGGILVESTVEQTLPVLSANLQGIERATQGLTEIFKKKDEELSLMERKTLAGSE